MTQRFTLMISGANRGIGRRNPQALAGTDLAPSDQLFLHRDDALEPETAEDWARATQERFGADTGGIDAVIHCADIFSGVGLLFGEGEEWRSKGCGK